MQRLVVLPMYDIDDIRRELAERRGRPDDPYSRQMVDFWVKTKLPMAEKVGGRYLLTEAQVNWLTTQIGPRKRAKA